MSWITSEPNPEAPRTTRFKLFAVLGTWMEGDVVAATIRNAFTQGCERVYIVDNDSPDDTVNVAVAEGALLAQSYQTERYDESLRLNLMNEVVRDVSPSADAEHIWWLFLDGDEFPHGPNGMNLRTYLETLDGKFRIVGGRFFDHYPSAKPHYVSGRHPLDFQPLCEELAFPMCPSRHRKHSLQRFDRGGPSIECGNGFHLASCSEPLVEPAEPFFLHHFPFREEAATRKRLEMLWSSTGSESRALESRDTHMLARVRSLDAVYSQDWPRVLNFIALDPMYESMDPRPPKFGVDLKPWSEQVGSEQVPVLRWDSPVGAWKYDSLPKFRYGDDTTYVKGIGFLDGHGPIEDWGCGFGHAKSFVTSSQYFGVDGSSQYADKIVDLITYTSNVDCIFMRHVLEHNPQWQKILTNAVKSFQKRMALVVFTPFSRITRVIASATHVTSVPVPDISFCREELLEYFAGLNVTEESLSTDTQYGTEHVFYVER